MNQSLLTARRLDWATRARLVAFAAAGGLATLQTGATVTAGGLAYVVMPGASMVPSLSGLVPLDPRFEHFGAVGDGTADDTPAVRAALASGLPYLRGDAVYSMASGPARIYSNTMVEMGPLAVFVHNTTSTALGAGSVFVAGPPGGTVEGGHDNLVNFTFRGGKIDLTPRRSLEFNANAFNIAHARDVLIEDVWVDGTSRDSHGIELNSTLRGTIRGCRFTGQALSGVTPGTREYINIDYSYEIGFPVYGPWDGTISEDILIENCDFQDGDVGVGSHLREQPTYHHGVTVRNCRFKDMISAGVAFRCTDNLSVYENEFVNMPDGIRIEGGERFIATRNTMTNVTNRPIALNDDYEVAWNRAPVVTNNRFIACDGLILQSVTDGYFVGNVFVDDTNVDTVVFGNTARCDRNVFADNAFPGLSASKSLYAGNQLGQWRKIDNSYLVRVPDDGVVSIPVTRSPQFGLVMIATVSVTTSNRVRGLYYYVTEDGSLSMALQEAWNVSGAGVTTGTLTGTTGTDGIVTVSADIGKISIENRLGAANTFTLTFL
jgi:hypothetical protein